MHDGDAIADKPPAVADSPAAVVGAFVVVLAISIAVRVRYAEAVPSYDELWHMALSVGRGTPFGLFAADRLYLHPRSQVTLVAAPPWWHVWTHMTGVLHPPLYCLTLRWWRELFGESNRVAQAYSIAWSCVAAACSFAIARASMGLTIATLLGIALALAPTQVYLAQEIRGYEMLSALGAIALWLMTRVELFGATRRRAAALGLMPLALLLTHYFAFGAAIAIAIFGIRQTSGHRRAFVAALATSAVVYTIAWLPFAIRQLDDIGSGDAFVRVDHRDLLVESVLALTAPFRLLIDRKIVEQPASILAGVLFVAPWFLASRLHALRWWAMWLTLSVGSLFVLDEARSTIHLGFARYLTVATPAVLPLIAGCAYAINRRLAIGVAAALVAIAGCSLRAGAWIENDCGSLAKTARFVAESAGPGDGLIVFYASAEPRLAGTIVLQCSAEPGVFPRPLLTLTRPTTADVARRLPTRSWLISPPFAGPIDALIPGARILWSRPTDAGLEVSRLQIDGGATPEGPASIPSL